MMRIKPNRLLRWPTRVLLPGSEADVPDNLAIALIKNGFAVPVRPQIETATIGPTELRRLGGGWYELPNGDKVQGKDAALIALRGGG